LQLALPQPDPRAVAAAAIGGDQKPRGLWIARPPHRLPPAANRVDREARRVVVDPQAHPACIISNVVDPVGRRPATFGDQEIVHPNRFGLTLGALPQRRQWDTARNAGGDAAILVVEADPVVREMLDLLFASEGYRTTAAADGNQALVLARGAIRPDLVVADYGLPNGLNGLQVVSGVREALGREIPAVVLTGEISTDTMREITRIGCVQRNKPVRSDELMHLIQFLLAESRRPTARAGPSP
jgi:CheY-like chemotaxis protein